MKIGDRGTTALQHKSSLLTNEDANKQQKTNNSYIKNNNQKPKRIAEIRQVGFIAARSPSINSSTCVSNRGNLRSAEVKLQLERDCLAQEVALNEAAESKLQLERDCLAQEIQEKQKYK